MSKKICFIVLTYHPDAKKILALLNSLSPFPTVVVDNTPLSGVNLRDALDQSKRKLLSNITYTANHENRGYTGGVNEGLRKSSQNSPTWMVVLNDDLELTKSIVGTFVHLLENVPPGLAGPYPRYLDTKRWTTKITDHKKSPDFLSGSFLAIHNQVFESLGYLYDPYFIFYEEVEYCVRAVRKGFPLTTTPLPGIEHEESSTFKKKPFLHAYYLARNHFLFIERNAPPFIKLYEYIRFPKTLAEHITNREWGSLAGIRDYFIRRFGAHKWSLI